MHFLWHAKYQAVLTVFSTTGSYQSWNRSLIFLLASIVLLAFSKDEILFKATYRKWPKSIDRSFEAAQVFRYFYYGDRKLVRDVLTSTEQNGKTALALLAMQLEKVCQPENAV